MTPFLHAGFLLFLAVLFPLWDRRETVRLKTNPSAATRIRSYQKTIAWLWLATVFLVVTTPPADLVTPPHLPGVPIAGRTVFAWAIPAALLTGILGPVFVALRAPAFLAAQLRQLAPLAFFLPQSGPERRWFAAVSLSAGICEELIFRGFLIAYLTRAPWHLNAWVAVAVAAIIFGIDHGYQGWTGMVATAVMALIFTAVFALTGRLWVAAVLHAALDLRVLGLLWLGRHEWPAAEADRPSAATAG